MDDNIGWLPWARRDQAVFVYTLERPGQIFDSNDRWITSGPLGDEEYYSIAPAKILDKKIITPESFLQSGKNRLDFSYFRKDPTSPGHFMLDNVVIATVMQLRRHTDGM